MREGFSGIHRSGHIPSAVNASAATEWHNGEMVIADIARIYSPCMHSGLSGAACIVCGRPIERASFTMHLLVSPEACPVRGGHLYSLVVVRHASCIRPDDDILTRLIIEVASSCDLL